MTRNTTTQPQQAPPPRQIIRRLTLGINVNDAGDLQKAGRQLDRFLKQIDYAHGPFDLDMAVSVNPIKGAPPAEEVFVKPDGDDYEIVVIVDGEDGEETEDGE
jgi:hypothetical protein